MSDFSYPTAKTALLIIDPFNDFISEGGKLWLYLKENAERVNLVENMKRLLAFSREKKMTIIFVPHHRHNSGDYGSWKFLNKPLQVMTQLRPFERGSWGGEFHAELSPVEGEFTCDEHWVQSGFANTNLDFILRSRDVTHLLLSGLRTNACFEATARYGVELGYHVTLVSDATAAFRREEMDATLTVNAPHFAHRIVATAEVISDSFA